MTDTVTDGAGTRYESCNTTLILDDRYDFRTRIGVFTHPNTGQQLLVGGGDRVYVEPAEYIRQVAKLAGLEVTIGERESVSTQPVGHVQVKVTEDKPKRPEDFAFDVVPRIKAIRVTEEYARSGIFHSGSKVAPKYDERSGTLLGVEVRGENGEMTGRVAQIGDYLVSTPSGIEVHWADYFHRAYREVDA